MHSGQHFSLDHTSSFLQWILGSSCVSEAHLETVTACLSCSQWLNFTGPTCVMAHTYVCGEVGFRTSPGDMLIQPSWQPHLQVRLCSGRRNPLGVLRGRPTVVIQLPVLTFKNKDALSLLPRPKASLFPYPLTSPGPIRVAYPSANRLTTSCYSIILGSSGISPN